MADKERIIWLVSIDANTKRATGLKALPDTPENRRCSTVAAAGAASANSRTAAVAGPVPLAPWHSPVQVPLVPVNVTSYRSKSPGGDQMSGSSCNVTLNLSVAPSSVSARIRP